MSEELVLPSSDERLRLLKQARHTALAADRICGTLLAFSNRLEQMNIIPKDRKTRKARDQQLRRHQKELEVPGERIKELVRMVQDNPNAEQLVASLFRDLSVRRIKSVTSRINSHDEKDNQSDEEEPESSDE